MYSYIVPESLSQSLGGGVFENCLISLKSGSSGSWTCTKHRFHGILVVFLFANHSQIFLLDRPLLRRISGTSRHLESSQDREHSELVLKVSSHPLPGSTPAEDCCRETVTGYEPGTPVSLTKGINGHCVFPLQMRKMTW